MRKHCFNRLSVDQEWRSICQPGILQSRSTKKCFTNPALKAPWRIALPSFLWKKNEKEELLYPAYSEEKLRRRALPSILWSTNEETNAPSLCSRESEEEIPKSPTPHIRRSPNPQIPKSPNPQITEPKYRNTQVSTTAHFHESLKPASLNCQKFAKCCENAWKNTHRPRVT